MNVSFFPLRNYYFYHATSHGMGYELRCLAAGCLIARRIREDREGGREEGRKRGRKSERKSARHGEAPTGRAPSSLLSAVVAPPLRPSVSPPVPPLPPIDSSLPIHPFPPTPIPSHPIPSPVSNPHSRAYTLDSLARFRASPHGLLPRTSASPGAPERPLLLRAAPAAPTYHLARLREADCHCGECGGAGGG